MGYFRILFFVCSSFRLAGSSSSSHSSRFFFSGSSYERMGAWVESYYRSSFNDNHFSPVNNKLFIRDGLVLFAFLFCFRFSVFPFNNFATLFDWRSREEYSPRHLLCAICTLFYRMRWQAKWETIIECQKCGNRFFFRTQIWICVSWYRAVGTKAKSDYF